MREFTLRTAPVCVVAFAVGCFSLSGEIKQTEMPTRERTVTHVYWNGVNAALSQRPAGQDLGSMLQTVRFQTDALRGLDPDSVDETLVAAVNEVIRCEEEVLRVAEVAGNNASTLRSSRELAATFQSANRKASDAKKRLRALRDPLNARHGGGFAALGG